MSEPSGPEPDPPGEPRLAAADAAAEASVARGRRGLLVALALALVAVVALGGTLGWTLASRHLWEDQNAQLRAQVDQVTADLDAARAEINALIATRDQLDVLKGEYSALVNDGASASEVTRELGEIIDGYETCVDLQQRHFDVLRDADRYVASSIRESEQSITDFCGEVAEVYRDYRATHG